MNYKINAIDKYWRAANYLTVANMYLNENRYLSAELNEQDVNEHPSGHWGTSPGVNFIYAHLNRYIKQYSRKTQLVIGPGHAGNALLANLQLEGNADLAIPQFNHSAMQKIISNIRTEVNPFYPGVIYDGGELGYSLAVSFAAVLDAPGNLCVCVIGDGEAETGTISASWNCKEFLDSSSGFVLPILHLNGFKMGGESILSTKSDEDICSFLKSFGFRPIVVNSNHEEMYDALDWVEHLYAEIERGDHNDWPAIIFRSPKGWTAPSLDELIIENKQIAHKNPLSNIRSQKTRNYLHRWVRSYHPEELFMDGGGLDPDILSIVPHEEYRLGNTLHRYKREFIALPDINDFSLQSLDYKYRNVRILEKYLSCVLQRNPKNFRIVSPDELQSNLLHSLKTSPINGESASKKDNGRITEILNENICQAWMQGYILTGRNCLMISYEAFIPVITSMVSQYAKWIYQANKVAWRKKTASMTYLLTSLCWSNTYSHQNPEFINSLLSHQHAFVRIYMPADANSLLACTEACLSSSGLINVIISSKQEMPQWHDLETAKSGVKNGIINWDWIPALQNKNPEIIFVAAGDYPVRECMEAILIIKELLPQINMRFLSVMELTSIGSPSIYPQAMDQESFNELFGKHAPVMFCFHGYPSAIKMLLYGRIDHQRVSIMGYNNQSITSANDMNKLILNRCSRFDIVLEAGRLLYQSGRINTIMYETIQRKISEALKMI